MNNKKQLIISTGKTIGNSCITYKCLKKIAQNTKSVGLIKDYKNKSYVIGFVSNFEIHKTKGNVYELWGEISSIQETIENNKIYCSFIVEKDFKIKDKDYIFKADLQECYIKE